VRLLILDGRREARIGMKIVLLWSRVRQLGGGIRYHVSMSPDKRNGTNESARSDRLSKEKIEAKALTGLRGIAALMVAIYHVNPELSATRAFAIGNIVDRGYLWVDLFFVLSGFVLALNYGRYFADGWPANAWCDFLLRRVARIFPLYFVCTLAGVAIVMFRDSALATELFKPTDQNPLAPGVANLLMVQSWGVGKSIDGTAWSLSAEWAAYLAFPILAGLALFGRGRTAALLALISAAAAVLTVVFTNLDGEIHRGPLDAYDGATCEPLLRCLAGFLMGLLAYRFVASNQRLAAPSGDVVCGLTLALLFTCLVARLHDLLILPLFPLVVVTVYSNRGRVGRFLGGKLLNALGLISYSIYLVHPYLVETKHALVDVLQRFLSATASDVSGSTIVYAALFFMSAVTYRFIEVPGRRFVIQLSNVFIGGQSLLPNGVAQTNRR
jgi:peptidoglycan/LPS O-acetylase OafA/YrhL